MTLFDSTGLAIQDLAIAAAVLEALREGASRRRSSRSALTRMAIVRRTLLPAAAEQMRWSMLDDRVGSGSTTARVGGAARAAPTGSST